MPEVDFGMKFFEGVFWDTNFNDVTSFPRQLSTGW